LAFDGLYSHKNRNLQIYSNFLQVNKKYLLFIQLLLNFDLGPECLRMSVL